MSTPYITMPTKFYFTCDLVLYLLKLLSSKAFQLQILEDTKFECIDLKYLSRVANLIRNRTYGDIFLQFISKFKDYSSAYFEIEDTSP